MSATAIRGGSLLRLAEIQAKLLAFALLLSILVSVSTKVAFDAIQSVSEIHYSFINNTIHPAALAVVAITIVYDVYGLIMYSYHIRGWRGAMMHLAILLPTVLSIECSTLVVTTMFFKPISRIAMIFSVFFAYWMSNILYSVVLCERKPVLAALNEASKEARVDSDERTPWSVIIITAAKLTFLPLSFVSLTIAIQLGRNVYFLIAANIVLYLAQFHALRSSQGIMLEEKGRTLKIIVLLAGLITSKVLVFLRASNFHDPLFWLFCVAQILSERVFPRFSKILAWMKKLFRYGKSGRAVFPEEEVDLGDGSNAVLPVYEVAFVDPISTDIQVDVAKVMSKNDVTTTKNPIDTEVSSTGGSSEGGQVINPPIRKKVAIACHADLFEEDGLRVHKRVEPKEDHDVTSETLPGTGILNKPNEELALSKRTYFSKSSENGSVKPFISSFRSREEFILVSQLQKVGEDSSDSKSIQAPTYLAKVSKRVKRNVKHAVTVVCDTYTPARNDLIFACYASSFGGTVCAILLQRIDSGSVDIYTVQKMSLFCFAYIMLELVLESIFMIVEKYREDIPYGEAVRLNIPHSITLILHQVYFNISCFAGYQYLLGYG